MPEVYWLDKDLEFKLPGRREEGVSRLRPVDVNSSFELGRRGKKGDRGGHIKIRQGA